MSTVLAGVVPDPVATALSDLQAAYDAKAAARSVDDAARASATDSGKALSDAKADYAVKKGVLVNALAIAYPDQA